MRVLRRNTTVFSYRKHTGEEETLNGSLHTGRYEPTYASPVLYRGNISSPSGSAVNQFYGISTPYTHVLVMDKPDADIAEDGLIEWKGKTYDIIAVRPSLNVLSIALKERTANHAPPVDNTATDGEGS